MSHDNKGFTPDYAGEKGGRTGYLTKNASAKAKDLEADRYDPYEHRDVPYPITNTEALFHMLKASCGTGILAMPLAFRHAGYAVGLIGTILIGSLCTYCVHILVQSEYELCRRRKIPSLTFPEIAYEAFLEGPPLMRKLAPVARISTNVSIGIYQLGLCSVYTLFIAENIKAVVDQYTTNHLDIKVYMCILLTPLILINWIRNLKYLTPCSTFAVAITIFALGAIFYYVFRDLPSFSTRAAVGQLSNMPLFFGTVIFALEAIGVIVPLENEMRSPKQFKGVFGVLNRGMIPIVFLYTFLGLFGYIQYGPDAVGSVTLNLPNGDILATIVKLAISIAIFGTHPLQCYVAVDIIWHSYLAPRLVKHPRVFLIEMIVRTAIVLFTFLLAVAIPNLGPFISLIGALSLSVAGIFIPASIQLGTHWYDTRGAGFVWLLSRNVFLAIFALLGLVTGTYSSILEIMGS